MSTAPAVAITITASRARAAAIMPIAVSRGGIDECPGVATAFSTSVA